MEKSRRNELYCEMLLKLIEPGVSIKHKCFGAGVVKKVEPISKVITVQFEGVGEKVMLLDRVIPFIEYAGKIPNNPHENTM